MVVPALPGFVTASDSLPAFELILTPAQVRHLRAALCEALEVLEWQKRTTSRVHTGAHALFESTQSDLVDIYEQLVRARRGALVGV